MYKNSKKFDLIGLVLDCNANGSTRRSSKFEFVLILHTDGSSKQFGNKLVLFSYFLRRRKVKIEIIRKL